MSNEHMPLSDQLEETEEVDYVRYNPDKNKLTVNYHKKSGWGSMMNPDYYHNFSELEVKFIRQGKITPVWGDGGTTVYDVHITLDEQRDARSSKFKFSK